MGRPLKIQKYSTGSSITGGAVAIDQAYPPFAAPTAMDTNTVVLPTPATTPVPFTGVVGGVRGGAVSATYPVVEVQCNIALPDGSGQGVENGVILRQKGARKFLVMSSGQAVQDEQMVVGAAYYISVLDTTDWQQMGAPVGAQVGTIFTCTAVCADPQNGVGYLVGQCVLTSDSTPGPGNMNVTMAVNGDSTAVYISKLTNKFVQDFNGGEVGGNADSGDVWNPTQVVNDIEYAANFFTDEATFEKSGAEVETWAGTAQNSNGTLGLAQVENYTS